MGRRESTARVRRFAALVGAVLGAAMLGGIGSWSGNGAVGAAAGGVVGGVMGYGVAVGTIGPVTLGAVFFAVLGCLIGPGYDDYGGHLAIPGACFGAVVGWLCRGRGAKGPKRPADDLS